VGANSFSGNAVSSGFGAKNTGIPAGEKYADGARQLEGATTFNYDLRLDLDTSFTGKDLLRTRLRAGNFADSPWSGGAPVGLNAMEVAFEESCGTGMDCGDVVAVNRLFYQFPIGSGFTATIGARVRQDDMLALWPSAYPADTIIDVFTYAGAPGAYSLNLGAGGGLWWKSGGFSISANYVSANGDDGNPSTGGIGTSGSQETGTVQLAYSGDNFGLAAAYTYSNGTGIYGGNGTPYAVNTFTAANSVNSVGVSGYWQPLNASWFPSISAGWGINSTSSDGSDYSLLGATLPFEKVTSQSWYVGLQWADAFVKGNTLGMAVGQPTFVTNDDGNDKVNDGNYAWEWWYKFQVTDNISVTPAIFYLSAPLGQDQKGGGDSFTNFGGLVKTTFKF
jgi:hypothetical protein